MRPIRNKNGERATGRLRLAVAGASLAFFSFGYSFGIIGAAVLWIKDSFPLTAAMEQAVVSAALFGAIFGSALGGSLADRIGRRKALLAAAALFVAGALGSAGAPDAAALVLARVAIGLGVGVTFIASPLYVSEISPARVRGRYGAINALAVALGFVAAYSVECLFAQAGAWRAMLLLGVIPAAALGVILLVLDESPRWLWSKGRHDQARFVFERLSSREHAQQEIASLRATPQGPQAGWAALFAADVRRPFALGLALAAFRSLCGLSVLSLYAPRILQMVGFVDGSTNALTTAGLAALFIPARLAVIHWVERCGRRPLLFGGQAAAALGFALLAAAFLLPAGSKATAPTAVAGLMVTAVAFQFSAALIPLMLSEIFPQRARGRMTGAANVLLWTLDFAVAETFLTLAESIGRAEAFALYASINVAAFVFTARFVPETQGKSLEQIEQSWAHAEERHAAKMAANGTAYPGDFCEPRRGVRIPRL